MLLNADLVPDAATKPATHIHAIYKTARAQELARRAKFARRLEASGDQYLVRRGAGQTVIAGYPWFTDWGRDTFISLRGLCLATGRLNEARGILLEWAGLVSEGMLPNRLPDSDTAPEYNSVDASLWYVIAAHEFLAQAAQMGFAMAPQETLRLRKTIEEILNGYSKGTRYGIHADTDGLLFAGSPGAQLTWMDAKVGDWVVTPRIGKPVEIQALWLNALHLAGTYNPRWLDAYEKCRAAFQEKFWNVERGILYDVIDCDGLAGAKDGSFRPNQLFAVGGLPLQLMDGDKARSIVNACEAALWTPMGPRSLAELITVIGRAIRVTCTNATALITMARCGRGWRARSSRRGSACVVRPVAAKQEARVKFLNPLLGYLDSAGLGHLPEIAQLKRRLRRMAARFKRGPSRKRLDWIRRY